VLNINQSISHMWRKQLCRTKVWITSCYKTR